VIANITVITDNLDYLLWGRMAQGEPGGVLLTLMMAFGAGVLALPGGIAARAVCLGGADSRHSADLCNLLAVVFTADDDGH